MAYTTIALIRAKTGYTEEQISDAAINTIISEATAVVNNEINTYVIRERVEHIDSSRQNKIDGSNKTFYVKNSIVQNFGDDNDDGELTVSDIKVEIENTDTNVVTEQTVSSIDVEGSYVLASAPDEQTTLNMWTTYNYTYYDITIPDQLIVLLTTYLASSYAAAVVEEGLSVETKFGNITVRNPVANTSNSKFTMRYNELLKRVHIPSNKPRTKCYNFQI